MPTFEPIHFALMIVVMAPAILLGAAAFTAAAGERNTKRNDHG